MLRKVFSLLFFLILSSESNLFSQNCGVSESVEIGGADGSFESCSSLVVGGFGLNNNITCGGWVNGVGSADSQDGNNNNMSLPASPDGGVFAGLFASSFLEESFYTDITGLTVSQVYTLKFYFVNTGRV